MGFRYAFDEEIQQYAHGAGIEVLTPRGVLSKYFYGIEFSPRDLRFGVIEASEERIGTADRQRAAALLPLRSGDREVRRGGDRTPCASARWRRCWRFGSFLFVSLRKERMAHKRRCVTVNRT